MKSKLISILKPDIKKKDWLIVRDCMKSNWISANGEFEIKFNDQIKKFTKAKFSYLCSSGSTALFSAIHLLGIDKNSEVIVPTITFVATINSVLQNNASPIFMDCDEFFNIDIKKTINFLNQNTFQKKNYCFNKKTKKQIKGIIVTHCFGNSVLLDELIPLCKKKGIFLIEDAAGSLGCFFKEGKYSGKHVGTVGDLGIISFNGNKIISAGGGGALLTNKKKYILNFKHIIDQSKINIEKFIHDRVGFNFRFNNLQSSIGYSQMLNINNYIKIKRNIHKFYKKKIKNNHVKLVDINNNTLSNYWVNVIILNNSLMLKKLITKFKKNNIQVKMAWHPNHLQSFLKKYQTYKINFAGNLVSKSILLPSSPSLNLNDQLKVINILNSL